MAAQSFAMGHAFGTSFQYGKRKISSMTNEEFNALTPTMLHDDLQADVRAMIPSLNQSFDRMERFQIEIIQSMLDTFVLALQEFGKFLVGGGKAAVGQVQEGFNTDVTTVQSREDIPFLRRQDLTQQEIDAILGEGGQTASGASNQQFRNFSYLKQVSLGIFPFYRMTGLMMES